MIGKQVKGTGFRGCLDYVLGKKGAYIISGTMCGQTPEALATEFALTRLLKPRLKKAVFHATLSVDATEKLDSDAENDQRWCALADDYMKAMGFDKNQYVVVKHTDTQHDHIHIVGSRIRFDGTVVDDSWDYYKSQAAIRTLEAQYNLQQITPSWESDRRSQTTGEYRKHRSTGNKSVRVELQALIDECAQDEPTIPELIERLQQQDTQVQVRLTRTGFIKGISYQLNGIAFSGTQLGKAYTFKGLQQYREVSYDLERDNAQIEMLMRQQEARASSNEVLTDESLAEIDETDATDTTNTGSLADARLTSSEISALAPETLELTDGTDSTDSDTDVTAFELATPALIDSVPEAFDNDDNFERASPTQRSLVAQSEFTLPNPTAQPIEPQLNEQLARTDAIILMAFDALIEANRQQRLMGEYRIFWEPQKLELSIMAPGRGEILRAAFAPEGNYQLQACQITEKDVSNFQALEQQQRELELD